MSTNYIYPSMEKYFPLRIMHNDEQQIQEQIQQLHKQERDRSFYRRKYEGNSCSQIRWWT